jgi:hypothetical protein
LMARIDGDLEQAEEALLTRIQSQMGISTGKVEKLQGLVLSIRVISGSKKQLPSFLLPR